jgi:uncharacterized protein YciI
MRKMKFTAVMLFLVVACSLTVVAQDQEPAAPPTPKFNAELAKFLGADDYGMRSYVFCTLKTGKTKIEDAEKSKEIFAGHFANMRRLAKQEKLVLAGPFVDGAPKRGLYIFNVTTIEEAEKLVKSDPAVQAGVFEYELTKLYCSAALIQINDIHGSIQKTKIE